MTARHPPSVLALAALMLASASVAPSSAQESDYTAQDVIRFFEEGRAAAGGPASPASPLCLGTADECVDAPTATGSAPAGPTPLPEVEVGRDRLLDRAPTFDLLVTFELNSARLTPSARERLAHFAAAANSPGLARLRFRIEGHTDALGDDDANLALSERRAEAVIAFLRGAGVEASRLSALGYGETAPREPNPYDPRNRRVEGRLLPDEAGEAGAG